MCPLCDIIQLTSYVQALCSEAHDQHNGTKALTELLWSSQVEPRPEPYYNNEQERDEWEEQYEQWSRTMNENMKSTNHTLCSDAEDDQHDIPIPGCDARYGKCSWRDATRRPMNPREINWDNR